MKDKETWTWILATELSLSVLALAGLTIRFWGRAVTEPFPGLSASPTAHTAVIPGCPLTPASIHCGHTLGNASGGYLLFYIILCKIKF